MAGLKLVPVRATVSVGGLSASTPYVVSFNVNRTRGQSGTCSATIKVQYESIGSAVGGNISIKAGPRGSERTIFTGICRSSNVTPCRDDPMYVMLTISGEDILSELKGKKITRRCKSSSTTWIAITGVVRRGLKDGKLNYQKGEENMYIDNMELNETNPVVRSHSQSVPSDKELDNPPARNTDRAPALKAAYHEKSTPGAGQGEGG